MSNRVKPCPFCGGHVRIRRILRHGYSRWTDDQYAYILFAQCNSCSVHGPACFGSVNGAVREWNLSYKGVQ